MSERERESGEVGIWNMTERWPLPVYTAILVCESEISTVGKLSFPKFAFDELIEHFHQLRLVTRVHILNAL